MKVFVICAWSNEEFNDKVGLFVKLLRKKDLMFREIKRNYRKQLLQGLPVLSMKG